MMIHNNPKMPMVVYRYYQVVDKPIGGRLRSKPIEREEWERLVVECKETVVRDLDVPDSRVDEVMYENNTIEVFLFLLMFSHGFKFDDEIVDTFRVVHGLED